jgi:hypothetical protein
MPHNAVGSFAAWLEERCGFLHTLEAEAERALQECKDTDTYRALMRRKALLLQTLPAEAENMAASLPDDVAEFAMRRLEGFAGNASRALGIGSVFYMYALLYPDDHIKGEPNDLDLLAAEIRELAGRNPA